MSSANNKKRGAGSENDEIPKGGRAKGLTGGVVEENDGMEGILETGDGLQFEDPFGDEYEEEDIDEGDIEDDDEEADDDDMVDGGAEMEEDHEEAKIGGTPKQVWRPGVDRLEEGEELEYDPSAYVMYHSLRTEWPCLSFDVLRDNLGENRQRFPATVFVATGSQADRPDKNRITLLKLSDLHKTLVHDNSDHESEDDADLDDDPVLEHINIPHQGGVNRIRSMPQHPGVLATMADTGRVHIYDASAALKSLMVKGPRSSGPTAPTFTFSGHRSEGFAVDWSSAVTGQLATGDCSGNIHVWKVDSSKKDVGGKSGSSANDVSAPPSLWNVDACAFSGHRNSVEDIQWSPTEATVFCSCSSDRTIKIWDTRQKPVDRSKAQISIDAHMDDVNVISWNKSSGVEYLLASGCDDGSFKVWDLRSIRGRAEPVANFTFHKGPITSIEWAPFDASVLCVSSSDNQATVWDLSVEADTDAATAKGLEDLADFPPQLLFIHQGQYNVKEIHHHPQIPGLIMSTAEDGFNVFKPAINVSDHV